MEHSCAGGPVPIGTFESRPPIHRWVADKANPRGVPQGRQRLVDLARSGIAINETSVVCHGHVITVNGSVTGVLVTRTLFADPHGPSTSKPLRLTNLAGAIITETQFQHPQRPSHAAGSSWIGEQGFGLEMVECLLV